MIIKDISIEKIVVDGDFNLRSALDKKLIADYKERLDSLPPVVVYETGRGNILVDGFHRLAAAKQENRGSIKAEVKKGSVQDALAYACIANLKHGLPLKQNERQQAVKQFIKLNVGESNVWISEQVGCSDMTILRYRHQMEVAGDIQVQEQTRGSDGKIRRKPTSTNVEVESEPEPDPYDAWFRDHVFCDDVFDALPAIESKFDLIIVDPPYGITGQDWDKIDVLNFTRRWLNIVLQKLKSTGRLYIFFSREYIFELKPLLNEIKHEYPLYFGGILVWNYKNTGSMPSDRKTYKITWEPIFYFYGLEADELHLPSDTYGVDKSEVVGDSQMDVWTEAIPQSNFKKDKRVHPAQKPLEIYKRIIETGSNVGDFVLDPFAGSGVTGHAAMELGRDFLLIEQDVDYIEGIKKRLLSIWEEEANNTDE